METENMVSLRQLHLGDTFEFKEGGQRYMLTDFKEVEGKGVPYRLYYRSLKNYTTQYSTLDINRKVYKIESKPIFI